MKCPLCMFEFDEKNHGCTKKCGLRRSACTLLCCPRCGYSFVDESSSKLVGLIKRRRQSKEQGRG